MKNKKIKNSQGYATQYEHDDRNGLILTYISYRYQIIFFYLKFDFFFFYF